MQEKLIAWLVAMLLKNLDAAIAAKALVGLLRALVLAAKDVAARTSSPVDDAVVLRASAIVDEIAAALKVP
jgi:hypothetical protein